MMHDPYSQQKKRVLGDSDEGFNVPAELPKCLIPFIEAGMISKQGKLTKTGLKLIEAGLLKLTLSTTGG